jgi:hypothetical protein
VDAKYPTPNSITTGVEWFLVGFTRITGTEILAEEKEAVYSVSTLKTSYD